MVERGLAGSRERAQALIMAGEVTVNGKRVDKAGTKIPADAEEKPTERVEPAAENNEDAE